MMKEHTNLKFLDCLENNLLSPSPLAEEEEIQEQRK